VKIPKELLGEEVESSWKGMGVKRAALPGISTFRFQSSIILSTAEKGRI